jgi:hypothetical protein
MVVVVMAVVMMTMMWNGDDGKCKYDGSDQSKIYCSHLLYIYANLRHKQAKKDCQRLRNSEYQQ